MHGRCGYYDSRRVWWGVDERAACDESHGLDRRIGASRCFLGRCRRRLVGRSVGWRMGLSGCGLGGVLGRGRRIFYDGG